MFRGISAIVENYKHEGFNGSLRFSISEKDGVRNIDLCEDTTINGSFNPVAMEKLKGVCDRIRFGWLIIYLEDGIPRGFDYKINFQGCMYENLKRECLNKCNSAKIVTKKSNT